MHILIFTLAVIVKNYIEKHFLFYIDFTFPR